MIFELTNMNERINFVAKRKGPKQAGLAPDHTQCFNNFSLLIAQMESTHEKKWQRTSHTLVIIL